ncbi:subunit 17 of mediator complex-domain-containing protein [Xylaria sp. CBS 124048]|nr:subunit 17 of mediator complex-domain-containing protein [Xylaria sp. CBS 124048]
MTSNTQTPFSLRPWPTGDKKPKGVGEFLARVNANSSGFRLLNEAQLRQEILAKQQERLEDGDMEDSSDEEEEEEEVKNEPKGKTALAARDEFLLNIENAHQHAMMALDIVSLLLSKESPVQAGATVSPHLRELVGIGTLGASKLKESNITEAQMHNDLSVATGWRVMGINNMADSVLAAAERLEKEIELETKYWADVLAVSDDGWAVCALPQEPHTLGVRFGFAESAPDYRDNSIAPLIRNDDGTIKLGVGKVGSGSQRIRITVKKNGEIIDQSPLPGRIPDDAPLKDRVREARNTIFHQELWYELNREARVLLSHDVRYDGPTIIWKQDKTTEFLFTLEDLDEQDDANTDYTAGIRSSAATYFFLQFGLFQSHRQNYYKRTSLSPSARQNDPIASTYNILRALITRFEYFNSTAALGNYVNQLVHTLHLAGVSTTSCSSVLLPLNPQTSGVIQARHTPTTELLWFQHLASNLRSLCTLVLTPDIRIWCLSRSVMRPSIMTYFHPTSRYPLSENKDLPPNPLDSIYPPPDYCANVEEAIYYLCQATVRVLCRKLAQTAAEKLGENDIVCTETLSGIGVKCKKGQIAWVSIVADKKVVLTLKTLWLHGTTTRTRTWKWESDSQGTGDSIEDVVLNLMRGDM